MVEKILFHLKQVLSSKLIVLLLCRRCYDRVVEKNDVIALKKCEVAVIFALIQSHFLTVVCHEVVVAVDGAGAVVDVVDDSVVAVVAKLTLQISAMTRPVFFQQACFNSAKTRRWSYKLARKNDPRHQFDSPGQPRNN